MNSVHEANSFASSFFAPLARRVAEGMRVVRSLTRADQKEVALAAELGLLGQHEADSAREGLEHARTKILTRSKF
jgi:hypothetical protein